MSPFHATAAPPVAPLAETIAPNNTVVSLTFDDGFASVEAAGTALARHNMHGTFYIPTGLVDQPGRLTWTQIDALQAAGNEIGGHTVNHWHLDKLDQPEQARQICDDRVALAAHGLRVTSFAYPFDGFKAETETIVKNCGYNSARSEGGFVGSCESVCPYAESSPADDPYKVRTASPVVTTTRLSDIEQQITDAATHGGGWVPLVFHDVCDACSDMAISPADFETLLNWIQSKAGSGMAVQTVAQVVGGNVQPVVSGPVDTRPPGQLVNSSLEVPADDGTGSASAVDSQCWTSSGYGNNTASWARVTTAHSGGWAERVTMPQYTSGDQKLIIREDNGSCAPAVTPGQAYKISAWYTSSAPTRILVFYRISSGAWKYWAESPQSPPSSTWQQAEWQTPPLPPEATRLSFGLQLAAAGTLTTDDYALTAVNANGGTAGEPAASIPLPSDSAFGSLAGGALLAMLVVPTLGFLCWRRTTQKRVRSLADLAP
ncbi:peptidoglycan/xylan/chitin deacetylase (PgdA/CDA1 family) [Arthrobacter bambusae]|nr:peptidoglycan/xylan/chitin deacetylase (PgdA/CDA1 family) [Arthrobacter bambusae]